MYGSRLSVALIGLQIDAEHYLSISNGRIGLNVVCSCDWTRHIYLVKVFIEYQRMLHSICRIGRHTQSKLQALKNLAVYSVERLHTTASFAVSILTSTSSFHRLISLKCIAMDVEQANSGSLLYTLNLPVKLFFDSKIWSFKYIFSSSIFLSVLSGTLRHSSNSCVMGVFQAF